MLFIPLDHVSGQALEAALLLNLGLRVIGLDLGPEIGNSILEGAPCADKGNGLTEQVPKRILSINWVLGNTLNLELCGLGYT